MLLPLLPLFVTALGEGAGQVGSATGIFTLSAILTRQFAKLLATKSDKKNVVDYQNFIEFATGSYQVIYIIATLILRCTSGYLYGSLDCK